MAKKRRILTPTEQGVALIDLVIERVRADPTAIAGFCGDRPLQRPEPLDAETLERLTFPSGRPLPPSLLRWLAFDASWLRELGWFASDGELRFTPRPLHEVVRDEFDSPLGELGEGVANIYQSMWGEFYAPIGQRLPECFLLPGGSDSRRIYAVTDQPDSLGEYPVLVIDTDDMPFLGVMYPGFDVFMGDEAGLCQLDFPTYEGLFDDNRYAARLNEHARHLLGGKQSIEMYDEEWGAPDENNLEDDEIEGSHGA